MNPQEPSDNAPDAAQKYQQGKSAETAGAKRMSRFKNAPGGNRGANQKTLHRNYNLNPLNQVLAGLENIRPAGKGYRADCPNGHRSKGSLAIAEGDDGRALLYCHAGCTIDEILAGLGLQKQDLYIRQDQVNATPQQKREWRDKVRQSGWKIALELLPLEILIVQCAAVQLTTGKPLNLADHKRLELAGKRISSARQVLCGS